MKKKPTIPAQTRHYDIHHYMTPTFYKNLNINEKKRLQYIVTKTQRWLRGGLQHCNWLHYWDYQIIENLKWDANLKIWSLQLTNDRLEKFLSFDGKASWKQTRNSIVSSLNQFVTVLTEGNWKRTSKSWNQNRIFQEKSKSGL